MKTFVVGELRTQASWSERSLDLGHFRTHDGHEVDLVIQTHDRQVVAVEVKASGTVKGNDLAGLRLLRDRVGDDFAAGIVIHLGERSSHREDRLHVLPIDALWIE